MINFYPIWKYLIIFIILIMGCVYSLPNFYGEDFAISITEQINSSLKSDTMLVRNILNVLKQHKINNKSIFIYSKNIQIRFFSELDQKKAYKMLYPIFSEKYYVSYIKMSNMPDWLFAIGAKPVKLGLDLKGGLYVVLRMDMEVMMNKIKEQYINSLQLFLNEKKMIYKRIYKIDNYGIEISFKNFNDRDQAIFYLSTIYPNLEFRACEMDILHINFSNDYVRSVREYTVQKNSKIIQHRLNRLKITESSIFRYGNDCIAIELPGFQDISAIKSIFDNTIILEFRLVNTDINKFKINNNLIPEDSELKLDYNNNIIPLYKRVILTGDHIINADLNFDEYHRPVINIFLDNVGQDIISKFTKDNIGKVMGTVLTEYKDTGKKNVKGYTIFSKYSKVINIATIQSQLTQNFCITGINNLNDARYLSSLLRMGSLVSPVYIEEERVIGPILGKKNITQGIIACILGIFISVFFMVLWYRFFGLIAGIALIINLILMISLLSIIPGVTLTMSSIAGVVLTLSVAIDSNVLINERIKEEMKKGKPIQYSIYMGYRKSFISIVDANITTIITASILHIFSVGSIQGFALTMIIGVGTSMFSSIIITRSFVNLIYGKKILKKLSI